MGTALRRILDTLFPVGDTARRTNELVELGVEALRGARDAKAVGGAGHTLVPSRLELRLAQSRYDELSEIGALRELEFHLNDVLLRDLAARRLRTFNDAPVYVTLAPDGTLQSNEVYAAVLAQAAGESGPRIPLGALDRTTVLGEDGAVPSVAASPRAMVTLRLRTAAGEHRVTLRGTRWIIGRRGSSGLQLPDGYEKVELDLPPTVSREQARVDLVGGDRLCIERIGKAPMRTAGEGIAAGESRLARLGEPFTIEDCEITIAAQTA